MKTGSSIALLLLLTISPGMWAQNQTSPGSGNGAAITLSKKSPIVQSAVRFLVVQAASLKDDKLRRETLDAIANPDTCIRHRSGLTEAKKDAILQALIALGLIDVNDDTTFPGGLKAGVFPPVLDESSNCAHLPQAFFSAPGSVF